jgi:hypothetical protein
MHTTVFGGEDSFFAQRQQPSSSTAISDDPENTECSATTNKSAVTPLPSAFIHDCDQLIDLALSASSVSSSSSKNKISETSSSSSSPTITWGASLAYEGLGPLLKLSWSSQSTVVEHAKLALKKNGTVFYAACSNFDEVNNDIAKQRSLTALASSSAGGGGDLDKMSGNDFGVLNAQQVTKHVYLSVMASMKHGASIVPCLLLGDDTFGIYVFYLKNTHTHKYI